VVKKKKGREEHGGKRRLGYLVPGIEKGHRQRKHSFYAEGREERHRGSERQVLRLDQERREKKKAVNGRNELRLVAVPIRTAVEERGKGEGRQAREKANKVKLNTRKNRIRK